jgi:hypothetical protein
MGKPAIKIISPTNITHPFINRMDNKVLFEWDPVNDSLKILLQKFHDMFINEEPANDNERAQIQSAIELSVKQIASDSKRDMFSPCSLVWTDKLTELKNMYVNMGNSDQSFTEAV